jgi:hypothetical protein
MVVSLLKGGLLGGLVMFIWLGLSWAVLPFHMQQLQPIGTMDPLAAAVDASTLPSGLYMYPAMPESADTPEGSKMLHDKAVKGPTISFMSYQANGFNPMNPMPFIVGLISCAVAAGCATFVLLLAAAAQLTFTQRLGVAVLFGLAVAFAGHVVTGAFFMFPLAHTLLEVMDQLVGWTLAGLVIAWSTKTRALPVVDEAGA